MFAYIKGKLITKTNSYVVIENNGIGYKIFMSQRAIDNFNESIEDVKIHTYYYVREDNISLYGFLSNDELRMFELLLSVSGIGAKSAIAMLSEISPSEFAMAVISNDTSKLVKIPGIGPKTAARLILELQDKLKTEESIVNNNKEVKNKILNDESIEEAVAALQILGYTKKEIEKVLEKAEIEELRTEDIIKKCLILLGK